MVKNIQNKNWNFSSTRTDLAFQKKEINKKYPFSNSLQISKKREKGKIYHMITFPNIRNIDEIFTAFKSELTFFLTSLHLPKNFHAFIIGLGNDNFTADSVGPKSLKHIHVNSFFHNLELNQVLISALEPGVLGETGIETKKIIKSVVEEIHPDLLILIDSYVSETIELLNHTIQITNEGIIPGSGIMGIHEEISEQTMGIPTLVIGVPTAIELQIPTQKKEENTSYLLSTKDVDTYVLQISEIIGKGIDEVLHH